jgi:hypothetical protein
MSPKKAAKMSGVLLPASITTSYVCSECLLAGRLPAAGRPIKVTSVMHLLQMLEEALKVSLFADRVE